ncbi:MAG: hypothetical protein HDS97_06240 [Bacteroidales bacterium]|nr:hypothetical protein [Bacteroidales bacterium]
MMTIKIDVEPYVAEYITGKYFDPEVGVVRFPAGSDIYHLIYDLLSKRPAECPVDHGNLEFALPARRQGKDPETYNYLSRRAQGLLERKMRTLLWAELHETMDEGKHLEGMQFKEVVYIFLRRYSIESISEDGLLKNYQRWRDKIRRKKKRGYKWKKS